VQSYLTLFFPLPTPRFSPAVVVPHPPLPAPARVCLRRALMLSNGGVSSGRHRCEEYRLEIQFEMKNSSRRKEREKSDESFVTLLRVIFF
jgi:hypothetical protein